MMKEGEGVTGNQAFKMECVLHDNTMLLNCTLWVCHTDSAGVGV